ncbi:unnamed protein product [Diplocarpon coronariae]|uniref:DUF7514 domain-containing protein n=1 Tax=Diplocarpon coronariae TaxID=2795749 RepID=A0A218YZG7_9HELO|nr:hypothetical protein B2J93_4800 [Marssonina coronariae]
MAYDAYGRPTRANGAPGSFDGSSSAADYTSRQGYYDPEPRDSNPSLHPRDNRETFPRRRDSPSKMATTGAEKLGHEGVSPELIAAITESVKKEVLEQLKQTGSVDIPSHGPPMQRGASNKSSSTSSPPPIARRVYTPPSPNQAGRQTYAQSYVPPSAESVQSYPSSPSEEPAGGNLASDRGPPAPASPLDKSSGVRFSDHTIPARPAGGDRTYSTLELSTVDQKWGRLFEKDGKPTQRLGQFLRGLANHMIVDFSPKKSIVVTPSKMAAYYAAYALDKEPHPLLTIFRAQSNEHISRLYQDLGCQHHLIQEDSHSAPIVPSLTPVGFAHWMTINILAYPEEEYRRLEKVVIALPIDADGGLIDGKPERLPKQISRHLLPDREDRSSRKLLDSAMENFLEDLGSTSRRKRSITSPPLSRHSSTSQTRSRPPVELHQARTSPTPAKAQSLERERKPYGGLPTASESSSSEESVRIERDRQPYSAQPGSGKMYSDNLNLNSRSARANSTSSREGENSHHAHNYSTTSQNRYPPRAGARRDSSPPFKSFSQSTPDDLPSVSSRYAPNQPSSSGFPTNPSAAFSPGSRSSDPMFPPPPPGPPPIDIYRRPRDERYRCPGTEEEDARFTTQFSSPREAEKWDRYHEEARADGRVGYECSSTGTDSRERAAPVEEWYREKGRGSEYIDQAGRRY